MERAQRAISFLRRHWITATVVFLLFVLLIASLVFRWSTGFGARTSTQTTITRTYSDGMETTVTGTTARGKTLWDWMELLIVPAVLAGGAVLFNQQVAKREAASKEDRYEEEALQRYLDIMSELLLGSSLRRDLKRASQDEVSSSLVNVAQVRTITVLTRVNRKRRDEVFNFLHTASLLRGRTTLLRYVDMRNVDLRNSILYSANLSGSSLTDVDLSGSGLSEADFSEANLSRARLDEAFMHDVNLTGANLYGANLDNSSLYGANLSKAMLLIASLRFADLTAANLTDAHLGSADLNGANLTDAKVTPAQLREAKSLEGAIMPDGRVYEPGMLDGLDDWPKPDESEQAGE